MSDTRTRWDYRLPKSIVSDYDLQVIVHSISSPLHYVTGTKTCPPKDLCAMCGNAVRLVVQAAEPKIVEAAITRMARAIRPHGRIDLHPRVANDIGV